jgi:hypothetical protein
MRFAAGRVAVSINLVATRTLTTASDFFVLGDYARCRSASSVCYFARTGCFQPAVRRERGRRLAALMPWAVGGSVMIDC